MFHIIFFKGTFGLHFSLSFLTNAYAYIAPNTFIWGGPYTYTDWVPNKFNAGGPYLFNY